MIKVGDTFGRLTVTELIPSTNGRFRYKCICQCGNIRDFPRNALIRGNNKSCGCLNYKHGLTRTRIYMIWSNMKKRCDDKTSKSYVNYGGRGITYCDKWRDFEGFFEDMKDGYSEDLTLDRIDPNGNYEKSNCRWVDIVEQANNRRSNHYITYKGETLTISQMAKKYKAPYRLVRERLSKGWSVEKSIEAPIERETLTYNGETKTVSEWASENGMTYHQLKKRLMRGWTVERALTQPLRIVPKK